MVAPALAAARRLGVPFFWPGVAALVLGRLEGVSSRPLQSLLSAESSSSEASSRSDSPRLPAMGVRRLPAVTGVVGTILERGVFGVVVGVAAPFGSALAVPLPVPWVTRSCSASFLMVRNWNWIPSGVD